MRQVLVVISKIEAKFVLSGGSEFVNRILQNKGNHTFNKFMELFYVLERYLLLEQAKQLIS